MIFGKQRLAIEEAMETDFVDMSGGKPLSGVLKGFVPFPRSVIIGSNRIDAHKHLLELLHDVPLEREVTVTLVGGSRKLYEYAVTVVPDAWEIPEK